MWRADRVALGVTVASLLTAGVWLPVSLTPPVSPGTWRPNWPEVVAFQPVWRAPLRAPSPVSGNFTLMTDGDVSVSLAGGLPRVWSARECAIEVEGPGGAAGAWSFPTNLVLNLDDGSPGLARAGVRFAGIEWTSAMVGGHVHWPMLAIELLAIAGLGSLTVLGLRIRARRAAARERPAAAEAGFPPAAVP